MAKKDVIEFECPRCLGKVSVPSDKAGKRIDCPSCEGSLLVPNVVSAGLFDDIFESETEAQPVANEPEAPAAVPESVEDSDEDLLAGIEVPGTDLDDINPLAGDDPFEVDENAPIKVDGIGDLFEHSDVFGFKCKFCDTRIHARPDQIGSHVECPECYSKLLIEAPNKNPKPAQKWIKDGKDKLMKGDDELKLSEPVERPKVEIDPSFGLETPDDDLLAPKARALPHADDDEYGLEVVEDEQDEVTPAAPTRPTAPKTSKPKRKLSRREQYEESQRKQAAAESGHTFRPETETATRKKSDFPDFDFMSLISASIDMLKSRGVMWRCLVALVLMSVGLIAMQWFFPANKPTPAAGAEDSTFGEWFASFAGWAALGGVPYLLGVMMLWFTSSYIYRDAALGKREVKTWKNAGASEWTGTFLIFSFGFFIGGLPALFLTILTLPLRFLFGPLLLLGSWYSQSPFGIVNVDAYSKVSQNMGQWINFYKYMFALAFVAVIAGLIFWMRVLIPGSVFVLTGVVSIVGAIIVVVTTLMFAAVCGWHCGKVVEGLEEA